MSPPLQRVAVFASGGGTNFQALLDHEPDEASWEVALLVMNRLAGAAERAEAAGVPVRVVSTQDRDARAVSNETLQLLDEFRIDVVLLAGYLRLLPAEVVRRFEGRILNIHPALLPEFGGPGMYGMNVHRAVVESGATESGATVHFVSEAYDEGGILDQARVPVLSGDTPEDLAARVLEIEHALYPRAVDRLCSMLTADRAVGSEADQYG